MENWIVEMPRKNLLILPLLLFSIPFGVAAHNFIAVIVLLIMASSPSLTERKFSKEFGAVILLPMALCLWTMLSTAINGQNPEDKISHYLFGYLPISLLPFMAFRHLKNPAEQCKKLVTLTCVFSCLWALVVLSQSIWGWSLKNMQGGVDFRPFGFYSHPLTLAYAALVAWPWALNRLLSHKQDVRSWLLTAAIGSILYFTHSRSCQAIALVILTWNLFVQLKGRQRALVLLLLAASVVTVAVTDNHVSHRFKVLISSENPDRFSEYPDDRVAFWHAHWEMVKERPLLGHGMHLNQAYREPFYKYIGLEDFVKKYEAHNQYLQVASNAGFIGLAIYLIWLVSLWLYSKTLNQFIARPFQQMLVAFCLGSLFQNAYYDSEVRHILMCIIIFTLIAQRTQEDQGSLSSPN